MLYGSKASTKGGSFLELASWVASFGEACPKTPKTGKNKQFQAKMPKYKNRIISKNINLITSKLHVKAGTINYTSFVA